MHQDVITLMKQDYLVGFFRIVEEDDNIMTFWGGAAGTRVAVYSMSQAWL